MHDDITAARCTRISAGVVVIYLHVQDTCTCKDDFKVSAKSNQTLTKYMVHASVDSFKVNKSKSCCLMIQFPLSI